jgi:voltage-gated potassium channel
MPSAPPGAAPWRLRLYTIIFEADTRAGRAFDVALLWVIVFSVVLVSLESVASIRADYGPTLTALEWTLTGLFTLEYVLRIVSIARPSRYVLSFYGLVDLAALLPSYVALLIPGANSLMVIRTLRLLRVFRILKLVHFSREARSLVHALRRAARRLWSSCWRS